MKKLKKILEDTPLSKQLIVIKKDQELVDFLLSTYPTTSLKEAIYLFHNELKIPPKCKVTECDNLVNWINNTHYSETCSAVCREKLKKQNNSSLLIQEKKKRTLIEKYGVDNPLKSAQIREKRNHTMFEKYGSLISEKHRTSARERSAILNIKGRKTIKEKYGVDNVSQLATVKDKIKSTLLEKYGVTSVAGIPYVKKLRKEKRQIWWDQLNLDVDILDFLNPSIELKTKYENPNQRIVFVCKACNSEETLSSETFKYRSRNFTTPCTACSGITTSRSLQEISLSNAIKNICGNVINNTREVISPFEIDIWLPDHNIGIEYCGLYWHSEIHDSNNKHRHIKKLNLANQKNIRLITIFEDEWIHKKEIVISRIKNLIGMNSKKIYARNCQIFEINKNVANKFCEENHIQGPGRINTAYGLYFENDLVSVMTFSKPNQAKGSANVDYELNRFCSLLDTTVIGAANKLFNQFIKTINPSSVVSYSDLRWNIGSVYEKMGFIKDNISNNSLNYWYIDFKKIKRIHRYALRKNSNDIQELTEWENRKLQGLTRIWDCGNNRYIWKKK